ncbi:MAG: LTA synthase family protein [Defluviitaleaceae bacterium]|nr:LTA synthase family protein [Defluviitaleaceae bacterium]
MINKISTKLKWDDTRWYPKALFISKTVLYTSLVAFPLFCMMIMEYMNFGGYLHIALEWRSNFPLSALFGAIVVSFIFAALLLICRKAVIACAILGLVSTIFGYVNFIKVATNGDNFFPRDIAMARNAGDLMSFVSGDIPGHFWVGVATIVVWVVVLGLFDIEIPITWKIRLPVAALAVTLVLVIFSSNNRAESILSRFNMSFFNAALQSSNYEANGFVSAFTINLLSMNIERPDGYSHDTITGLLEGFEYTSATQDYFDVIVVLSESFFDVRILPGVYFSENPLPNFDEIIARPNAFSGLVYTTALNGGTIRPEFDILTGLTTDFLPSGSIPYEFLRGPMATHVSNYRDAGYRTIALHPFTERFYMRHIAYPFLGFDAFYGYEQLNERFDLQYAWGGKISDISFFETMKYFLDDALIDAIPMFMFAITMQNHQPFPPMPYEDIRIHVTSDMLTEGVLDTVTSFTHGLSDADTMLGMLVDYIDNRDRPTVMLFFGDHLPNLGGQLAAFTQTGMLTPGEFHTPEARMLMYSTPFIIYSNRELAPILPNLDNHISTYYLLPILAYQTGFYRTAYMNLLLDYFRRVPFHNARLNLPETDDNQSLANIMRLITYDRLVGGGYSVTGD